MSNRHTTGRVSKDRELTVEHTETDSPIIPVAQLERLHSFKPEAVDWVIAQTQIESEHRRKETSRVHTFIFIEHLLGQIFALIIGISGVAGGAWVALSGQPGAGGTIAVAAITGLAVSFITGRREKKQ